MTKKDKPQKLTAICASHIDNSKRLERFKQLLASIGQQIVCYIGISCSDELKSNISSLGKDNIKIIYFKKKHSQFMRYALLLKYLDFQKLTSEFLMFTDDDDLWAPDRSITYREKLECNGNFDVYLYQATYFGECAAQSWNEIPRNTKVFNKDSLLGQNYFSSVVKAKVFREFLTYKPFWDFPLADVLFNRYLVFENTFKINKIEGNVPIYFWRITNEYEHNSRSQPPLGNLVLSTYELYGRKVTEEQLLEHCCNKYLELEQQNLSRMPGYEKNVIRDFKQKYEEGCKTEFWKSYVKMFKLEIVQAKVSISLMRTTCERLMAMFV